MGPPPNFRRPDNCTICDFYDCERCLLYGFSWGSLDSGNRVCDDFRPYEEE